MQQRCQHLRSDNLSGMICNLTGASATADCRAPREAGTDGDELTCVPSLALRYTTLAARAERAVLSFLGAFFSSERVLPRLVAEMKRIQGVARRPAQSDSRELQQQLAEAEAEASRLVEALGRGILVSQIEGRMRQIEARLAFLRAEAAKRPAMTPARVLPSAMLSFLERLPDAIKESDVGNLRPVLRGLVERIEVMERPAREGHSRSQVALGVKMQGEVEAILG